jgi:chromosome segregation ATPase
MTDETTNEKPEKFPPHIELQKLRQFQRKLKAEVEQANKAINEQIGKLESQLPHYGEVSKHSFDKKHGTSVYSRGRQIYPDGSVWNPKNLHYGPDIEAPPAPARWILQIEFIDAKIEGLLAERTKIQNAVAYQNSRAAGGADELYGHWREDLKAIKTKLDSLRNKRARLSQKLKEQDENWHRKQRLNEARIDRRNEASLSTAELNKL